MQRISERKMNLANVKNVRKVNTGGNTRHEARIQTYRVDHGCGYCMRVGFDVLASQESYTNSFSNGNSGPEIVELNAKIRSMVPAIWMDGETFTENKWTDKSGNGNDSTHTQNVRLSEQTSAAHGCGTDISPDAKLPHLRWCSRKDGPAMINTRSSTSHAMTDHQETVFGPM
jgi:hypothetical protein